MKMVDRYIEYVNEEMDGAMQYAENYVIYKTEKPQWAQMFHDMSMQELTHADYLMSMAQESIDTFSYLPEEDKERWEHCRKHRAEKDAIVRFMLAK